jgi:hypothetical protein
MHDSAQAQLATNLILADGLSGAGKSTMCQWLELQLRWNTINARWLFEADLPHPLHWWDYWSGATYRPPDLEHRTPAQFIEASIAKWSAFAAAISGTDQVWVVESALFLLGIGMLLQADAQPEQLLAYGRQVHDIIQGLNPILLYYRQNDVAAHVRKICTIRGTELEHELIANMQRTPYFKHRGLTGLDGVARLWSETQQITDALFPAYTIRKLALETSGGDWETYRRQIMDMVSLPLVAEERIASARDLIRLTGSYWCRQGECEQSCAIVLEGNRLKVRSQQPQAVGFFGAGPSRELIPIDARTFYMGIAPVVISFVEDATGGVREMRVDSTRLGGGQIKLWERHPMLD